MISAPTLGAVRIRPGIAESSGRPARVVGDADPYDGDSPHPVGRDAHIAPGSGRHPAEGRRGRRPLRGMRSGFAEARHVGLVRAARADDIRPCVGAVPRSFDSASLRSG